MQIIWHKKSFQTCFSSKMSQNDPKNRLHSLNAVGSIFSILAGRVILSRLSHLPNAHDSISRTSPEGVGILDFFRLEAVTEAEADIHFELYTFCPHAILVRDERAVEISQTGG